MTWLYTSRLNFFPKIILSLTVPFLIHAYYPTYAIVSLIIILGFYSF